MINIWSRNGFEMSRSRDLRAWVEVQSSADPRSWAEKHAAGLVPDRAPYGLNRLADHGVEPVFRHYRPGHLSSSLGRLSRKAGGFSWYEVATARPPREADVAVCWDERYGVPRTMRDGHRMPIATGVIWAPEKDANPSVGRLASRVLRRSALVWVQSSAQLPVLRDEWRIPGSRLAYLPFGIDADFFRPDPAAEVDPDLIVSVGNDRHRDHRLLIEAVQALRRTQRSLRLELVTSHALPRAPGVVIRPHLSHADLRDLYRSAAVIAVVTRPNTHVSGATAFLEAMACGRPLVTIDNPGVGDYVGSESGIRVPPSDPEALAKGLLTLLAEPGHGAELGAAGRRAIVERFSTDCQARALADLLRSRC